MVIFENVGVEFGTQRLYRDVNLTIGPNDRIGLVGPNGSGKSTLFRMVAGELAPDSGSVSVRRGTRVAYLPQTGAVVGDNTVLEEALTAFGHLSRVGRQMRDCERRMGERGLARKELDGLLGRYARLQQEYEADAYDCESRAKKVLVELGFGQDDFDKRVREQSGGFQVRLTLARMLLEEPDLLLLDEPTNYLDIRSIEWLQQYLAGFKGAFVMVAHDRYLLDGLVRRIWAIEPGGVLVFNGDYSRYLEDRVQRDEQQQKKYEEQQALIRRTENFIARFKGRKDTAKRAMSRQKMLDKLERIAPPREETSIVMRFPQADEVHGKALELSGVARGYGGDPVFRHAGFALKGGEKLGLFGANGQGKTTLLRVIAGELEPDAGKVWRSRKTSVAYYEQGAEERLDPELTVLETVRGVAEGYTENELKGILGLFLFRGDSVDKKVAVLSGGERSRLAILGVLLSRSNLLILDEPTNHLDIQSREVLFDAIGRYRRTVVFAAHDRFMLDRLADKTVQVEDGRVVMFPGNYSYASARRPVPEPAEPPEETKPAARPARRPARPHRAPDPAARLRERLARVTGEYDAAMASLDLNRARALAQEQRALERELEAVKASQVAEGDG